MHLHGTNLNFEHVTSTMQTGLHGLVAVCLTEEELEHADLLRTIENMEREEHAQLMFEGKYSEALKKGADVPSSSQSEDDECVVCFDNLREVTFQPCEHNICCKDCAERILKKDNPLCPFCRAKIEHFA